MFFSFIINYAIYLKLIFQKTGRLQKHFLCFIKIVNISIEFKLFLFPSLIICESVCVCVFYFFVDLMINERPNFREKREDLLMSFWWTNKNEVDF